MPRRILSDNGKSFKAAAKFLKTVFCDETVQKHLAGRGVQWTFNLEKAPWWGGVFERLVKSTKRCLRKMAGRATLSLDELHTALVEVESILNSRPLIYVASSDLEEPLTPSHLLVGRRLLALPDNLGYVAPDLADEEFTVTSNQMDKRMKLLAATSDHFWRRWRQEYLTEFRESHRQANRYCDTLPSIAPGDIVIVHDESLPRGFWRLGKIEEVITGRDGKIRGAKVTLTSSNGSRSQLSRPVQRLYPLEIHSSSENKRISADDNSVSPSATHEIPVPMSGPGQADEDVPGEAGEDVPGGLVGPEGEGDGNEIQQSVSRCPRRAAAERGVARRRACIMQLELDSEDELDLPD